MPWETFAQIPYDFRMRLQIPAALSCVENPLKPFSSPISGLGTGLHFT